MHRLLNLAVCSAILSLSPSLRAAWLDPAWPFRREVSVDWPAERATGTELAMAEIYTAGHHVPSGENIRVATEEGRITPSTVLMTGPGDQLRVAFSLIRGVRRYYVYFGNPSAPPLKTNEQFVHTAGVMLEMRGFNGPQPNNPRQMELAWNNARRGVGRTLVNRIFQGFNPFNDQTVVIAKYSGTLNILLDGSYTIAASASHRGMLFLDGDPLLLVPAGPPDTRFNTRVDLKRGKHELVFYHANIAGEIRLSVVWKRPDSNRFEVIPAEAFGLFYTATPGVMEEHAKPLFADFKIEYLGECFFSDHYSHRYRFTAQPGKALNAKLLKYEWDLGDGQTSTDSSIEQVYLTDGEYPIKLTVRAPNQQTDAQTNRISVSRLYEHLDNPPADVPSRHAEIAGGYDLATLPADWLPWDLSLQSRTRRMASIEKVALRLATLGKIPDASLAVRALNEASVELVSQDKLPIALHIWDSVSPSSSLQPQAAITYGQLLLYRVADFNKAARILEPLAKSFPKNQSLQRLFGQALILDQRADEGRKVLEQLPLEGPPEQQAAHAGAFARSIEFYITEKDPEAGEQAWDKWQQQYPADFLEGYSLLLETQLMELNKLVVPAAKVAEAFALAMPKSSYAPRLLDRASKLLARLDPPKSQSLREMLRKKYPEDPLSQ